MPLSDAERQQRYRERKEAQGAKRYQIMLPQCKFTAALRDFGNSCINCCAGAIPHPELYQRACHDGNIMRW
jgi:hypothetical protein